MARKKWFVFLLILLIVAGLVWGNRERKEIIEKEQQKTAQVKKGDLEKLLSLSGEVHARQKITLRFQASGLLAWVGVKEGDWVKKYQALASLDKRELQKTFEKEMYDYLNERNDFEQGEDDYQAVDKWFELSDEVKRILDKNQNDLNKAVLDVELANLAVKYATLVTPIEGIVTVVDAPYAGVNITPATADFEIVNPSTVYFSAQADEEEVVDLAEGKQAVIILDAYPEKQLEATLSRISFVPISSGSSPNYQIDLDFEELDNTNLALRLEMEGEAQILLASVSGVLYIPIEALQGANEDWVYVVNQNWDKEKREIKIGLVTDDYAEVTEGLNLGEAVLVD
ncbi:MAG: efflux RND transporter periplasmic adaptor subunit [Candidatus Shapirobacteria bacterium]